MNNFEALVQAATIGNTDELRRLIDLGTVEDFGGLALQRAAEYGHPQCLQLLIDICSDQEVFNLALLGAASAGHYECLQLLIPVSNPKALKSKALRLAACHNHTSCVALLIGVSDCHSIKQEALRRATELKNQEMFDLLYPYSNAQEALTAIQSNPFTRQADVTLLTTRIKADQEKEQLLQVVHAERHGAKKKIM